MKPTHLWAAATGVVVAAILLSFDLRLAAARFDDSVCLNRTAPEKGLCVAYCDALNCDRLDPVRPACLSLRRAWERVTTVNHSFPCDKFHGLDEY